LNTLLVTLPFFNRLVDKAVSVVIPGAKVMRFSVHMNMQQSAMLLISTTAISTGIVAGVLFAFSSFVMPALADLPSEAGLRSMQAINARAERSVLLVPLLLSPVGALGLLGFGLAGQLGSGQRWLMVGAVLAIACFVVTIGYHVPHNNVLALLEPAHGDSLIKWRDYLVTWQRANHVRIGFAVLSAAALTMGLASA
jgi:uncharacterized membrane protein